MNNEYECVCLRCGKIFRSEKENDMFCSDECKSRYSSTDYSGLYWEDNMKKESQRFSRKLIELRDKGEDYVENQKRDSIEKFAKIDVEEIMRKNGYYKRVKEHI